MIKNKKEQAQMIITDLDNTLLRRDQSISVYTQSIFEQCRAKGLFIAFATARSENSCRPFIDAIKPDAIISSGGAIARVGEKIIHSATMSPETTSKILQVLQQTSAAEIITVDTDKGYFVNQPVEPMDPDQIEYLPAYYRDFSKGLDCPAYRIAVLLSDANIAQKIASDFPTVSMIPFSGEMWFCFADQYARKEVGSKILAAHLGVDMQQTVAFGDDFSDIEMLRLCGCGVAVANAISQVNAVADDTCGDCDEDGVARWIEEKIFRDG